MSGVGRLILVVGASGAGKDTLINWAASSLPGSLAIRFVELEITRPVSPWGRHIPIALDTFESRKESGYYVLHWQAHGASYGVPDGARGALDGGASVVTIASRAVVDAARRLPWECHVVEIRAPFPLLQERLAARGREGDPDIESRLKRASQIEVRGENVHVIDNGGALADSGSAFNAVLTRLAQGSAHGS